MDLGREGRVSKKSEWVRKDGEGCCIMNRKWVSKGNWSEKERCQQTVFICGMVSHVELLSTSLRSFLLQLYLAVADGVDG